MDPFVIPGSDHYFEHKPGCVHEKVAVHRIPIDCVTVDDLWKAIETQKAIVKDRDAEIQRLKAEIYDLRADADDSLD